MPRQALAMAFGRPKTPWWEATGKPSVTKGSHRAVEIAFVISLRKCNLRDLSFKFGALRSCHRDLSIKKR